MKVLKQQNVSFIVAPYEADAQMTFLAVSKQVDAVITEDSDLIAFGCPRVSFLVLCLQFFNSQYISFNFFVYNLSYRKRSSCFIDASILNVTCVSY